VEEAAALSETELLRAQAIRAHTQISVIKCFRTFMFFKRPPPNQSDRGRLGDLLAGRLRRFVAGVVRATPKPNRGPDHAGAQQRNSHANRRCWIPRCRDRLHIRWAKPWLPAAKSLKPQLEAYTIGAHMRSGRLALIAGRTHNKRECQ
jgi:hypothetical protein